MKDYHDLHLEYVLLWAVIFVMYLIFEKRVRWGVCDFLKIYNTKASNNYLKSCDSKQ